MTSPRINPYAGSTRGAMAQAFDDEQRKRQDEEDRLQANKQLLETNAANEARRQREDILKKQEAVAKLDAYAWLDDPNYAKPYAQQPQELKEHFRKSYEPEVAAQIPGLMDEEAAKTHIKAEIPPGLEPSGATVDDTGKTSITYRPKADAQPQSKAQEYVDKAYSTDFVKWQTGEAADVAKSLAQLREAKTKLGTGDNVTGPIIGISPDWALAWTNPEAIKTREAVEEVVQRNLRAVLGAQFTAKEGERLIARAFNPRLSEEENSKRLDRLLTQIESAAKSKQEAADYFAENGTLAGWKGDVPSMANFDPDKDVASDGVAATPQQPTQPVQVNSQAEYDALPSGAKYIDSNGRPATKK